MEEVFNLSSSGNFIGQWWLPCKEDLKIIGILNYSTESGLTLNLEGFFKENEFDVIIGEASGSKITLLNCFATTLVTPFHELAKYAPTQIYANMGIIGLHADAEQNIQLEYIKLETNDIKAWTCFTGIDYKGFSQSFEKDSSMFNIPYKLPESEVFYAGDDAKVTLNASLNIPSLMRPPTEIVFTEKNIIKITNEARVNGLFFFDYIDAIRKFITLAMRENVTVQNVRAMPKGSKDLVHVLYMPIDIELDYVSEKSSIHDMFFTFPKEKHRISELFKSWLCGYNNMMTVYSLYFMKNKGMLHSVFLPKAQALEEYHRVSRPDADGWGFKSRISNLFEKYIDIMKYTGDKEVFSQLVLDHRDYFSHWLKKKENKVFKGINLDYLNRDVNLLLEMCLLTEMGFSVSEIIEMVEGCHPYRCYLDIGRPQGASVLPPPRILWKPGII
jgi:hypothetical protein